MRARTPLGNALALQLPLLFVVPFAKYVEPGTMYVKIANYQSHAYLIWVVQLFGFVNTFKFLGAIILGFGSLVLILFAVTGGSTSQSDEDDEIAHRMNEENNQAY